MGRVGLERLGEDVIVTWLERFDGGSGAVKLRRVSEAGALRPSRTVARTGSGRASGFPRTAVFGGDVYVSWTEAYSRQGPSRVQVAKVVFE